MAELGEESGVVDGAAAAAAVRAAAIAVGGRPAGDGEEDHDGRHIGTAQQLQLSYQGDVFTFDTVPAEKVQAVLLLLGSRENAPPPPMHTNMLTATAPTHKVQKELPRMSVPHRLASLERFKIKRKERSFEKKVRYDVRKEVAQRMHRNKGQFASSKDKDAAMANQYGQPTTSGESQTLICTHCGVAEGTTPMMRRGPNGPKSLCNACGLYWANKGMLRDLSKHGSSGNLLQQGLEDPSQHMEGLSDPNQLQVAIVSSE
eukprot:jgi/Chlat1/8808/Chrsp90S08143